MKNSDGGFLLILGMMLLTALFLWIALTAPPVYPPTHELFQEMEK